MSHQTTELVKSFYNNGLVSRQAPGKKDFVTVRQDNKKEHLQKRHLLCSLQETFAIFVKDNPTVKISLSKFASLQPMNVKLSFDMPRDVCLCKYHENVKLLAECLSKAISSFPNYSKEFVDNFVCDSSREVCMLSECDVCPRDWLENVKNNSDIDEPTMWYQWERVAYRVKGKTGDKTVKKMQRYTKRAQSKMHWIVFLNRFQPFWNMYLSRGNRQATLIRRLKKSPKKGLSFKLTLQRTMHAAIRMRSSQHIGARNRLHCSLLLYG